MANLCLSSPEDIPFVRENQQRPLSQLPGRRLNDRVKFCKEEEEEKGEDRNGESVVYVASS